MGTLRYYTSHGSLTDPGSYAPQFAGLPLDLPELCRFIQGIVLHADWAAAYGIADTGLSRATLPVAERMKLAEALLPQRKTPGTCRDFALLLCSLLRQHSVPARVRCGFATYFTANPFEDHWVCEYWNQESGRWALADAQLDELQCKQLRIDFDTTALPPGKFLHAGQAWSMWRAGKA
ncbi:MAG TPA: transglutaminase domain-containing protein, partial [Xanthobacteraceae bacterium]|nr:transglutaminase domain-containing protein [Xanthobacteraceae bacterium]